MVPKIGKTITSRILRLSLRWSRFLTLRTVFTRDIERIPLDSMGLKLISRFWTMASTFTGLKLQGELGRFGTTELTDIEGKLLIAI